MSLTEICDLIYTVYEKLWVELKLDQKRINPINSSSKISGLISLSSFKNEWNNIF